MRDCGNAAGSPRHRVRWACLIAVLCLGNVSTSSSFAQTAKPELPCAAATTTAAMKSCESSRYEKANQQMQAAYAELARQLDAAGKQKLQTSQNAWLRFRVANASFQADAARGGTLVGVIRLTVLADMTERRAADLQKDLQARSSPQ